jgi:nucleotide-binding universal stress UspA family protein
MNMPEEQARPAGPVLGDLRFNRLLVALDGSGSAELALAAAVTAARRDNSALTLLTVVPDMVADSMHWGPGAPSPVALQQEADEAAERTLREAVERIPRDIPVTTVVRRGKAGPEIVAYAREHDFDAVLLGARGVGRVASLIGSVSSHVIRHAPTAVFVAHAPTDRED